MKEEDDPIVLAQANFCIGAAAVHCRSFRIGKRYLKRAVQIIRRNDIRFVPSPPVVDGESTIIVSLVEPPRLMEERVTLLTQVVSMELLLYLLGQPTLVLTGFEVLADEEPEFPVRICNY